MSGLRENSNVTSPKLIRQMRLLFPSLAAQADWGKGDKNNPSDDENSWAYREYEQTWDYLEMEEDKVREPEGYDGD